MAERYNYLIFCFQASVSEHYETVNFTRMLTFFKTRCCPSIITSNFTQFEVFRGSLIITSNFTRVH